MATPTAGDPFSAPAPLARIDFDEYQDQLLLITVISAETQATKFDKDGPSKCIKADVAVLTGDHAGEIMLAALIFPRVLYQRLEPNVGGMVLGRLRKVQSDSLKEKYGKNASQWDLDEEYTEEDRQIGLKWVKEQEAKQPDPFSS